jgi:hypothetical protein
LSIAGLFSRKSKRWRSLALFTASDIFTGSKFVRYVAKSQINVKLTWSKMRGIMADQGKTLSERLFVKKSHPKGSKMWYIAVVRPSTTAPNFKPKGWEE